MSAWDKLWDGWGSGYYTLPELIKVRAEGDKLQNRANKADEYYRAMREFQERNSNQAHQIRGLKKKLGWILKRYYDDWHEADSTTFHPNYLKDLYEEYQSLTLR